MPAIKEYSKGSVIYFEGDKSRYIYLLQSGNVILIYKSLDETKEEKYHVKTGEFFGVKSALGKYPREETAQVLGGARLIIFTPEEFQQLSLKNPRLVLQISKVFSKELREIHSKIREILRLDRIKDPEYELMNVGESFYVSGNIEHAQYVFEKYLNYYPEGKFKERAEMLLIKARKGETYPLDIPSLENYATKIMNTYEEEHMVQSNMALVDDDLFQMPELENSNSVKEKKGLLKIEEINEKINVFINNNLIKDGYDFILDLEKFNEYKNLKEYQEYFLYEKGRLLILLKNYNGALELLLSYLKLYPGGKFTKNVLLQCAIAFELLNDIQKSKLFYKKVISLKPEDDLTKHAQKRLLLLEKN